jgi:hypothetical protein
VFPATDRGLARDVLDAVDAQPEGLGDEELRAGIQTLLRRWYRSAVVVAGDDFGRIESSLTTWYVYRDGKIRRPNERLDRLYGSLASARQTERDTEATLEASRSAAEAAGFSREPSEIRRQQKAEEAAVSKD